MEALRHAWEETPMTAEQIARAFETTRGAVIGLATRRGWKSYNGQGSNGSQLAPGPAWEDRTLDSRLAQLHREMDRAQGREPGKWGEDGRWTSGPRLVSEAQRAAEELAGGGESGVAGVMAGS